jgi:hypothetical protein
VGGGWEEFQKFTQNRDYVKHTMYSVQTKITKYARRQENGTGDLAENQSTEMESTGTCRQERKNLL